MYRRSIFLLVICFFIGLALAVGCGTPPVSSEKDVESSGKVETGVSTEPSVGVDAGSEATKPEKPPVTPETKPETSSEARPESKPESKPVETVPEPELPPPAVSYYNAIKAILLSKCLGCHKTNGIAPFELDTYDKVNRRRALVRNAIQKRIMPPWQGDNSCNDYKNNFDLTDPQRAKIIKWIDDGALKGDPKDYKAPPPPGAVGLPRVDVTLKIPTPYKPTRIPDDYRCFVLDWPAKKTKFITGFQVNPGNPKLVHHVIAYLATKSEAAYYEARDKRAAGQGYRCFGVSGGPAGIRWIGVWAPGVPGSPYAKDTGLRVEPGSKIILQVHYNVLTKNPKPDQTSIDFMMEDSVKKQAILLPWTNPSWLSRKGMKIPAGQSNVKHDFKFDLFAAFPLFILYAKRQGAKPDELKKLEAIVKRLGSLTIHTAMLHMHLRGQAGQLYLERSNKQSCLLKIPRWDFNWQLDFKLRKPVTISSGDNIGISCTFDNSSAKQPIVGGIKQKPKDVYWGDGTNDEMCLGVFYITCQDKSKKTTPCPDLGAILATFL